MSLINKIIFVSLSLIFFSNAYSEGYVKAGDSLIWDSENRSYTAKGEVEFKNEKLIVSNRNDFFNNIVFIDDLSKYILKIIKTRKFRYNLINLASKNKLKISNLINFIYEKLKIKNKKIIWTKNKKKSFTINLNKASQNGYFSSSVKKSLENYIMEIKNKL